MQFSCDRNAVDAAAIFGIGLISNKLKYEKQIVFVSYISNADALLTILAFVS